VGQNGRLLTCPRIFELQAELRVRNERLAHLRAELTAETARCADQSVVELTAPVSGSVWELLAAPGEEVRSGQDLLRLLGWKHYADARAAAT
jgi:biotin carboxyl carrier protein